MIPTLQNGVCCSNVQNYPSQSAYLSTLRRERDAKHRGDVLWDYHSAEELLASSNPFLY